MADLLVNDDLTAGPVIDPKLLDKFWRDTNKQTDDRLNKLWENKGRQGNGASTWSKSN